MKLSKCGVPWHRVGSDTFRQCVKKQAGVYGVRYHIIDTVLDAEQLMVAWWFSKQLGIAEQEDFDVLENPLAAVFFNVGSTERAH